MKLPHFKLPEGVEITALAGDEEESIMIANTVHVKESQGTGVAAAEEAELAAAAEAGDEVLEADADAEGEVDADAEADDEAEAGDPAGDDSAADKE